MNMPQSFGAAMGFSLSETLSVAALPSLSHNDSHLHSSVDSIVYLAPTADTNKCWPIRPTLRNELDTFSVHFYVFFGPNISIPPDRAAVFAINLMPVLDSGGVLNMELKLNMVSGSDDTMPSFTEQSVTLLDYSYIVSCLIFRGGPVSLICDIFSIHKCVMITCSIHREWTCVQQFNFSHFTHLFYYKGSTGNQEVCNSQIWGNPQPERMDNWARVSG